MNAREKADAILALAEEIKTKGSANDRWRKLLRLSEDLAKHVYILCPKREKYDHSL